MWLHLLCGPPNIRITGLVRPSVCPSCTGARNSKTKRRRKTEINVNVAEGNSNRFAIFSSKGQRSGTVMHGGRPHIVGNEPTFMFMFMVSVLYRHRPIISVFCKILNQIIWNRDLKSFCLNCDLDFKSVINLSGDFADLNCKKNYNSFVNNLPIFRRHLRHEQQLGSLLLLVQTGSMTVQLRNCSCCKQTCMNDSVAPHRGLPPWRGGGAYAPMTRTIFLI